MQLERNTLDKMGNIVTASHLVVFGCSTTNSYSPLVRVVGVNITRYLLGWSEHPCCAAIDNRAVNRHALT